MGFDFDKVLNKLENARESKEAEQRRERERQESELDQARHLALGLEPPTLARGLLLYKPVLSKVHLDADGELVETQTVHNPEPFITDRGTTMFKVCAARTVSSYVVQDRLPRNGAPLLVERLLREHIGTAVGPHWCVLSGKQKPGVVCFVEGSLPNGWTWLEVVHVQTKKADREGGRDRQTLFAKAVVGSMEELVNQFGYARAIARLRRDAQENA